MNFVIQTSQPAPKIYSRSSRIIAVTSVIVIFTLIVTLILQCIKSWHINFIGEFTLIACALAHLCWVVSTVNMLSQDISKRLIRLNQAALITPNVVIVMALFVILLSDLFFPELRYTKQQRSLMSNLTYIFAFTPPIIAWLTNTALIICSMIKVHKYLKN
jgi:hypothetical protein